MRNITKLEQFWKDVLLNEFEDFCKRNNFYSLQIFIRPKVDPRFGPKLKYFAHELRQKLSVFGLGLEADIPTKEWLTSSYTVAQTNEQSSFMRFNVKQRKRISNILSKKNSST